MTKDTVTKVLFWLAFGALLATTIPHVAWFFHSFEPKDSLVWWFIAYAVAISFDVLVGWLAFMLGVGGKGDKVVTYSFIAFLVALSWFANWLYSVDNAPVATGVWAIMTPFGVTTGEVSPFVVSAIPLFILAYTTMLGRLNKVAMDIAPVAVSIAPVAPDVAIAIPQVAQSRSQAYEAIKVAMGEATIDGKLSIPLKDVAAVAKVGHSTVKKHAPAIKAELGIA